MTASIHTPNNLYNYIKKTQNITVLKTKIKEKEEELSRVEEFINNQESLGFKAIADVFSKSYNKLMEEIILLKLELNQFEKQTLLFELIALREN